MRYIKYFLIVLMFSFLSGCYTQLAIGDLSNETYDENGEYEDEEYAYEDSSAYEDSTYYSYDYDQEREGRTEINNYYYFDNDIWPGTFYRRYYWDYYPHVGILISGNDFYDWYGWYDWYDWNYYGYRCCWYFYSYYDPYFYNPYYYYDPFYYGGYYTGGVGTVYKYRSRSLTRLRNTHGGRGLALRLRPGRNLTSRGSGSASLRKERNGRSRDVDESLIGVRPTVNGEARMVGGATVNGKTAIRKSGRSKTSSGRIGRGTSERKYISKKKRVYTKHPTINKRSGREESRIERKSKKVPRSYKAPSSSRERRATPKVRRHYTPRQSETRSYYTPPSSSGSSRGSSYSSPSYSSGSSQGSYSSGSSSRSSGRSSRGSSRRR